MLMLDYVGVLILGIFDVLCLVICCFETLFAMRYFLNLFMLVASCCFSLFWLLVSWLALYMCNSSCSLLFVLLWLLLALWIAIVWLIIGCLVILLFSGLLALFRCALCLLIFGFKLLAYTLACGLLHVCCGCFVFRCLVVCNWCICLLILLFL